MTTLEQRLYDGDRAKEILENEVFIAVWADVEKDLIESWRNLPSSDGPNHSHRDAREKLHLSLTLLNKVKACIQQTMETGKLAQLELQHRRSLAERLTDAASRFLPE